MTLYTKIHENHYYISHILRGATHGFLANNGLAEKPVAIPDSPVIRFVSIVAVILSREPSN